MNYSTPTSPASVKPKPTTSNRIQILDFLRGITLFGILLTHSYSDFRSIFELVSEVSSGSLPFKLVNVIMSNLFTQVLYSIFSFLFGLSFAIQLKNSVLKARPFTKRFLWRLLVLLLIGFVHSLFFARDILQLYALLGMLLVFFKNIPEKGLVLLGVFFSLFGIAMTFFNSEIAEEVSNLGEWSKNLLIMRTLGLSKIDYLILSGRLFIVFSLFIWGLYAGKQEIFKMTEENRNFFLRLLYWSGGVTFFLGVVYTIVKRNYTEIPDYVYAIYALKRLAQSAFYVALFVKLYELEVIKKIGELFVPVGKMGLTIYVTQSIFLIYYYELDNELILDFGLKGAILATIAFFFVQMGFAWTWMSVFQYGPLEWIWRSLTYFKVFNLLKKTI